MIVKGEALLQSTDINPPAPPPARGQHWLDQPRVIWLLLCLILLAGAWFRFHGQDWDAGRHLHPDERFLSTTTNDLQWPDSLAGYFDPYTSTLSPYALPNMGLFVYGTFPVYLVKGVAVLRSQDTYDQITIIGRTLSALFDLGAVLLLFLIGRRLYGSKTGLLAAALLAMCVLNIQLAHFFAVDTFANFFILATIYALLRAIDSGRWLAYALTGVLFGLGLASKISTLTLAVPILLACGYAFHQRARSSGVQFAVEHVLVRLLTIFFVAGLVFRLVQPIAFSGPGLLDLSWNPRWWEDITEQQQIASGAVDLPWVQQWTARSLAFPLENMLLWGMGLPLGLASFAGLGLAAYELARKQKIAHLLPLAYVVVTFGYHAITFVKFMRYFFPVYPFLVLLAAYLLTWLWQRRSQPAPVPQNPALRLLRSPFRLGLAFAVVTGGSLFYALAFGAIYDQPHTRIAASRWIYDNIPAGSTLANEHWDDWLPIGGLDGKTAYGEAGQFQSVEMKNYEDDTPAKLDQTVANLIEADYIVLSSNRLYSSIPRLPMRYPLMTRYYELLFGGALGFERVADFTSYPTFLGLTIPDQAAEESFTVYDHPRVQIFQKTAAFDPDQVRAQLGQGIAWESVLRLTPLQASLAPGALLFRPAEQAQYQQATLTSSQKVRAESWGSRMPVLAWFLVVQLFALLALPFTLTAFAHLSDRGYIFSKAVGLLMVGWAAWLIASLRIAPFTGWLILLVCALLGAAGVLLARRRWAALRGLLITSWRWIWVEEGLFWVCFAVMVAIRMHNPDLWHPGMGGEKPMDLAYLTAIVRTPFFPPYDPWFAGGYINYYYVGFVLVAALIHLTGIVPAVAYNLAVPTIFAMTAMGGFSVALNLAASLQERDPGEQIGRAFPPRALLLAGLCGALFVAVIGNLSQVRLLFDGLRALSTIPTQDGATWLTTLAQFVDGASRWLAERQLPAIHTEWWYWNATRVIPPAQGEAGPINEMPFFTFLFGDLHAHMIALPYTLLALGLALNIVRQAKSEGSRAGTRRASLPELANLGLLALVTGALWAINTWDFPTYTLFAAGAIGLRAYARRGRLDLPAGWAAFWQSALVVLLGRLLFQPFHAHYAGANLGAALWKGSQTALAPYLWIHGFFLFVIGSYLLGELLFAPGQNAVVQSLRGRLRFLRLPAPLETGGAQPPGYRLAVELTGLALVLVLVILIIQPVIGLALALALLAGLLMLTARPDPARQFLHLMILAGLLLTVLVEVVVLKGDISRMNTVFKFYLQVWVLWACATAAVLPVLGARLPATAPEQRIPDLPEGSTWTPEVAAQYERLRKKPARLAWAQRWWWAFGLLLAACFLYPLTATPARTGDRFEGSTAVTLDGSAYQRASVYYDENRPVPLDWDRQAFDWLRQNVQGIPTILEANTPLYRWGARVSINTGLPAVIGWDWHQKQQRGVLPGSVVDQRIQDVKEIYTSTDSQRARALLQRYAVQYVYVGPLEQLYYPGEGLTKFDRETDTYRLVYQNEQVKIYQVTGIRLPAGN